MEINLPKKQPGYGLVKAKAPPAAKSLNVFQKAMKEDEPSTKKAPSLANTVNNFIRNQSGAYQQKLAAEASKVMQEDPNAYEYDELYDDFTSNRKAIQVKREIDRKPQYIESLKKANERRNREQNIAWERMEQKERERESLSNKNEQKFVTESYMRQMELNKEYEKISKFEEKYNEKRTANSEDGMMKFYSGLLNKNTAMGGGTRSDVFNEFENKVDTVRKSARDRLEEELNQNSRVEDERLKEEREKREQERTEKEKKRKEEHDKEMEDKIKIRLAKIRNETAEKEAPKEAKPEEEKRKRSRSRSQEREKEKPLTKEEKIKLAKEKLLARRNKEQ